MAIAFVSASDAQNFINDGGTLAYAANVSAGSLLLAFVNVTGATEQVNGITDTLGNTWARAVQSTGAVGRRAEIWYTRTASGGANTLTFDFSGAGTNHGVVIAEFSGFSNGVSLDQFNSTSNGTNTTTHSAGSITTTVADAVLVAVFVFDSGFSINGRLTGWNPMIANIRQDSIYKIASATETTDAQVTTADVERGPAAIASFYETVGGGGGNRRRRVLLGRAA